MQQCSVGASALLMFFASFGMVQIGALLAGKRSVTSDGAFYRLIKVCISHFGNCSGGMRACSVARQMLSEIVEGILTGL